MILRSEEQSFWILYIYLLLLYFDGKYCDDSDVIMVPGTYSLFGDRPLPSSFSLNITINNSPLSLYLDRRNNPEHNFPVCELSRDDAGKYHIKELNVDHAKEFAVYSDFRHSASFLLHLDKRDNGMSQPGLQMEGILFSEREILHLSTTVLFPKSGNAHLGTNNKTVNETVKDKIFKDVFFLKRLRHTSSTQESALSEGAFPTLPFPDLRPNHGNPRPEPERHKRYITGITRDINIDVTAVTDFAVYVRWYNTTTSTTEEDKKAEVVRKLNFFYALVFNGIDLLYNSITSLEYKINVHLQSLIITMNAKSSYWTEILRKPAIPKDKVDDSRVLFEFSNWGSTTSGLHEYDHLMLFTGYDLVEVKNGQTFTGPAGIAYLGKLCDPFRYGVSVIEDAFGFNTINLAAHELGHSVSAIHDGYGNDCSSSDGYIMTGTYSGVTEQNKHNFWKFSPCSISNFNRFLSRRVLSWSGSKCLYETANRPNPLPDVTSLMPGQEYPANEQCRLEFGPASYVCQDFGATFVPVCLRISCYNPLKGSCDTTTTARGTTCGNKKWCIQGECVSDAAAPEIDESCIFGDSPAFKYFNKPCNHLVVKFAGHCYNDNVRKSCCQSCAAVSKGVKACEPGFYGAGCTLKCGACKDVICAGDGSCPDGCEDGWKGDKCMEENVIIKTPASNEISGSNLGIILGIIVGVLALLAGLLFILYRRKKQKEEAKKVDIEIPEEETKPPEEQTPPAITEEKVVEADKKIKKKYLKMERKTEEIDHRKKVMSTKKKNNRMKLSDAV